MIGVVEIYSGIVVIIRYWGFIIGIIGNISDVIKKIKGIKERFIWVVYLFRSGGSYRGRIRGFNVDNLS